MSSRHLARLQRLTHQLSTSTENAVSANDCAASFLDAVTPAPTDAIFLTKQLYAECKDPKKMNLGVGAYRDNNGKPYPLNSVRKAEALLLADRNQNKEYLSITGHVPFLNAARDLAFGEDFPDKDSIAACQSLSGTGALRLGAEFIKQFMPGAAVYCSNPTWGNHFGVLRKAGVEGRKYRYWDEKSRGLDINGLLDDLRAAPRGSVIMLHACAHNPTGVDPTFAQWQQIYEVMAAGGLFPWFDSAYQGFASGDLAKDAAGLRYFAARTELILSQSFAKNLGLYNERVGGFYVRTQSPAKAKAAVSQLATIVRPMYSNPPAHGAKVVHMVLTTPALREEWYAELRTMSGRILEMRALLRATLEKLNTPGDWSHITSQIGMFSYTGLTPVQVDAMIKNHSVFLLSSGRISMAGINHGNVEYLANAINDVVRNA